MGLGLGGDEFLFARQVDDLLEGLFDLPAQLLSMLPYLATIVVLTVISAGPWKGWLNAPACLGKPFHHTV